MDLVLLTIRRVHLSTTAEKAVMNSRPAQGSTMLAARYSNLSVSTRESG